MHEITLCQSVLRIIEAQAAEQKYEKVMTVWLEVGVFAGVELEALKFGFEVVTKDSIAAGARLEIVELAASAWCQVCQKDVEVKQRFDVCPTCGGYPLQVKGGDVLRVKELEVV